MGTGHFSSSRDSSLNSADSWRKIAITLTIPRIATTLRKCPFTFSWAPDRPHLSACTASLGERLHFTALLGSVAARIMSNRLLRSWANLESSYQVGEFLFDKFRPLQKGALLVPERSFWVPLEGEPIETRNRGEFAILNQHLGVCVSQASKAEVRIPAIQTC